MRRISLIFFLLFAALNFQAQNKMPVDGRYLQYQNLLQLADDDSIKCARLISYAAKIADSLSDYNLALIIFEKVEAMLNQKELTSTKYQALFPKLYSEWGCCLALKGEYEAADKIYSKALGYSEILDANPKLKAGIYNKVAINLMELMVYTRALNYYTEAVELYTRLNDESGKGKVYHNMATLYMLTGNYEKSDEFFDKAADIYLKNKKVYKYLATLNSKAIIKAEQGKFLEAKSLFLKVLRSPYDDVEFYVRTCYNAANIYAELKNWDSCAYFQWRGKKISDSLKLSEHTDGSYYYSMGDGYAKQNQLTRAIAYYKLALKHKTGIHSYRVLYDDISRLYVKQKQYDSAFLYKKESIRIADSIYQSELSEHKKFENKRRELLERDYENQLATAQQQQFLNNLEKRNVLLLCMIIVLITFVLLLFFYFKQYRLKLKKEKLQSELDFLKAQLNPHFLFNSLNNIYVLLEQDKNKAVELLVQFCELLRYQLYECDVASILLNKELKFLENYVDFEQLRYGGKITVEHNLKEIDVGDLHIAPIVLQPFIENAFKHSPKSRQLPGHISIHSELTENIFFMEVKNQVNGKEKPALPGGIGLENVKKRLELLYPGKHKLDIEIKETTFHVKLKIDL